MENSFDQIDHLLSDNKILADLQKKILIGDSIIKFINDTAVGKAISEEIKIQQASAIKDFVYCDINDIEAMKAAKMKLTVAQNTYSIFSAIIQESNAAEDLYKQNTNFED